MGIPSSFNPAAEARAFDAQDAEFDASLVKTQQLAAQQALEEEANAAEAAQEKLAMEEQENATTGMQAQTRQLQAPQRSEKVEKAKQVQESVLVRKEDADEFAGDFSQRQGNKEYHIEAALLSLLAQDLGSTIQATMTSQEIIDHVISRLRTVDPKTATIKDPDPAQVDKAFEFILYASERQLAKLEKTSPDSPDIKRIKDLMSRIEGTKQDYYDMPGHGFAIEQAKKIIAVASDVMEKTGLSAKETLDKLRTDINTPQDVQTKRKYYEQHGGYSAMLAEAKTQYHYIGESLKRVKIEIEGQQPRKDQPTLESSELLLLNDATKVIQAATRVVILSKTASRVIEKYLNKEGVIEDDFRMGF